MPLEVLSNSLKILCAYLVVTTDGPLLRKKNNKLEKIGIKLSGMMIFSFLYKAIVTLHTKTHLIHKSVF